MDATAKWIPGTPVAVVTGPNGRRTVLNGIHSQAEAETAAAGTAARWEAEDAAREQARQERQSAIDAEGIKQKIAKAAATPHFAGALAFLKLIQYSSTCPYFEEIRAEMDRLALGGEEA